MKIDQEQNYEVITTNKEESKSFGIDEQGIRFMAKMASDNFYSNKIGSVVREIVSNAVDANVEAGTDKPVEVSVGDETYDEQTQFIVRDFGHGMSPEIIESIYTKYWSSTKRESNSVLGAFGIGSKSPLSYVDMFFLNTYSGNTLYKYTVYKGDDLPQIQLLEKEQTDKEFGTEVIIPINTWRDARDFREEIINQLLYMKGVVYKGVTNDTKVIEKDTFFYITNPGYSTQFNKLHAVNGNIYYPLDIDQFDTTEEKRVDDFLRENQRNPIGIKFGIGELDVPPNREMLEYTKKTKENIIARVKEVIAELDTIERITSTSTDDYEEFRDYLDEWHKQLRIAEGTYARIIRWHSALHYSGFSDEQNSLIKRNPRFYANRILENILVTGGVAENNRVDTKDNLNYGQISHIRTKGKPFFKKDGNLSKRKNLYMVEQFGSFYLVEFDLAETDVNQLSSPQEELIERIKEEDKKFFDANFSSYNEVVIPDVWLDEYMQKLKDNRIYKESKEEIPLKVASGDTDWNQSSVYFNMDDIQFRTFHRMLSNGVIFVYGNNDNHIELLKYYELLLRSSKLRQLRRLNGKFDSINVIKISAKNAKHFKEYKNFIHIDNFKTSRYIEDAIMTIANFKRVLDYKYKIEDLRALSYYLPLGLSKKIGKVDAFLGRAKKNQSLQVDRAYIQKGHDEISVTSDVEEIVSNFEASEKHKQQVIPSTTSKKSTQRIIDIGQDIEDVIYFIDNNPLIEAINGDDFRRISEKTKINFHKLFNYA